MSRKLFIALYAVVLLALATALPFPHKISRDLSPVDNALSDRVPIALASADYELLERRASRKSRAVARKAKGVTTNPKTGKKPREALAKGIKGAAAQKHIADAKSAKNKVKNDSRNRDLAKVGAAPVSYAASKKGLKAANTKRLKAEQRADDQAVHAIKSMGRPAKSRTEIAREKADRERHISVAKAEHVKSLATGTFPARNAVFKTEKGNTFTGKDVRQASFTAHLSAQKPVGYKMKDGSTLKKDLRQPKEFGNREQGPVGSKSKPLPDISSSGAKYREYTIVHDKMKGHDGRSPNPSDARLITKPNAAGVHEFVGVVAHRNLAPGERGYNDHHLIAPTI